MHALPDIFDEVEEDLRAERARAFGRRFAGTGIALFVLILVGTGGYVYWKQSRQDAVNAVADRFITAASEADKATKGTADAALAAPAAATLANIAATGPAGYRVLAGLRLGALQWQTGQHTQALATWQAISNDPSAPKLMADLAILTSAQHQLDTADPAPLKNQLQALSSSGNPWRPMAQQLLALLDIRTGNTHEAANIMQRLTVDPMAPEDMRQMAADVLTTLPADTLAPPAAAQAVRALPADAGHLSGAPTPPAAPASPGGAHQARPATAPLVTKPAPAPAAPATAAHG